jgi:hypothetical protein
MNPPPLPPRKPVDGSTDPSSTYAQLAPPLPLLCPPPLPPRASINAERPLMAQEIVDRSTDIQSNDVVNVYTIPSTTTLPSQAETAEQRPTQPEHRRTEPTPHQEPSRTPFSSTSEASVGTLPSRSAVKGSASIAQAEEVSHLEVSPLLVETMKEGRVEQNDGSIPLSATQDFRLNSAPSTPSRKLEGSNSEHHLRTRPSVEPQDPYIPLPVPPLPLILLLSIPMFLAYLRINFILLCGSFVGTWYIWADWKRKMIRRGEFGPEVDREKVKGLKPTWQGERHKEESVEWM